LVFNPQLYFNMKTSIQFMIVLWGILFLTAGCESFLELEPKEVLPSERALTSPAKVEQVMANMYSQLADNRLFGQNLHQFGELMADNVDITQGSLGSDPYVLRSTIIFTQGNRDVWSEAYQAIRVANNVIDAIDKGIVVGSTPTLNNQWKGECLTIRALMHFELVRLFGHPYPSSPSTSLGVVIRTEALTAEAAVQAKARATVQETYTQVISDLNAAIPLLPTTNNNRSRITSWAARAILSRVYFNQNNFASALTQADAVLTGLGEGTNAADDTAYFRNSGLVAPKGGVVWQLLFQGAPGIAGQTRPGTNLSFATGPGSFGQVVSALINDSRNSSQYLVTDSTRPFSRKWAPQAAFNMPMIRIHELFLIRAEAAQQTGQTPLAQASLDSVRRQYYSGPLPMPATSLTGTALLDEIRTQRRIEMVFEHSDRYHELRRTQQAVRGFPYNDRRLLLAIPDNETGANPLIVQN
jgi:starch-binding outer membrane protein, SusD/RagB family